MTVGYNRIPIESPFENVMEDINYIQAKEDPQKNFKITPKGWIYLHEMGISEEDVIHSRKTLEEFCAENSMVEGKHFMVETKEFVRPEVTFKNGFQIVRFNDFIKKHREEIDKGWAQADLMKPYEKKSKSRHN